MLVAALVLGLLGGLIGLFIGMIIFLGELVRFVFGDGGEAQGVLVMLFAAVAIGGAVVCLRKPWCGAALLVLSGAGSWLVINMFGVPVLFFTFLAAFFAVRGNRELR